MIKEKETWKGNEECATPVIVYEDKSNELTSDLIRKYLEDSFRSSNLAVTVTQDDIKLITGFLKKAETSPCLVVTSTEKGDDLSKYILGIMKDYEVNTTMVYCAWYGESLSTRLLNERNRKAKKYNKKLIKQERDYQRYESLKPEEKEELSMSYHAKELRKTLWNAVANKIREKKIKKLEEKYNQARVGENEYYAAVSLAVKKALDSIAESYPAHVKEE